VRGPRTRERVSLSVRTITTTRFIYLGHANVY